MTPSKDEFIRSAKLHNVVPVFAELIADMQTPVSVFAKIEAASDECFLLESAENIDNWGRYCFIGRRPRAIFTLNGRRGVLEFADGRRVEAESEDGLGPLSPLRDHLSGRSVAHVDGLPHFVGGAVGYFGYECAGLFEKLPKPKGGRVWDDARFALYDDLIIFDNLRHRASIVACAHIDEFENAAAAYDDAAARIRALSEVFNSVMPPERPRVALSDEIKLKSNFGRDEFIEAVEKAKECIRQGEIIQIVPSQKFSAKAEVNPVAVYRALRLINPSPYMYFFKAASKYIVGSSPETLLRFRDGRAEVRPIAGTRRRGADQLEDMRLADELLSDEKERAEHLMLVDLGRNDLAKFCEAGSVQVSSFMSVERYSHVMHIVSDVSGFAQKGMDAFDAFRAVFPAGTLSGAPKIRAMEIINELENERRGPYGGAVGYIGYGGSMDLAITIRTLLVAEGQMSVQAGAGIVYDSDAEKEYEETRMKARALERSLQLALKIEKGEA